MIHNPVISSEDVDALSTSNTDDLGYVGRGHSADCPRAGRPRSRDRFRAARRSPWPATWWKADHPKLHPHQAPDVQRRNPLAPSHGQDRRRAGAVRRQAGGLRRALPFRYSTAGSARSAPTITSATPALFPRADRAHPIQRRSGDPLRHRRLGLFPRTARRRRRRHGLDWRINIDQAWIDISYRSAIRATSIRWPFSRRCPNSSQGPRTAAPHRNAPRPHLQPGPRNPAGDAGRTRKAVGWSGNSARPGCLPPGLLTAFSMRVAVVGGGISGLSCAYYLDKTGHRRHRFRPRARRAHRHRPARRLHSRNRPRKLARRQTLGRTAHPRTRPRRPTRRFERRPTQDLRPARRPFRPAPGRPADGGADQSLAYSRDSAVHMEH